MEDHSSASITGIYSQPYNEIVKPEQIWPVSKYFLRRWVPYLTPTRFWTVIAARQLAYRLGDKRRFKCYDSLLYKEACCSRANFYRIKAELEEKKSAISLFISRAPTQYQRQGAVTKPGPTIYNVRLDDILTPADATYLTVWLQSHKLGRDIDALQQLLQDALSLPPSELLAPSLSPYLDDAPTIFQPLTVADIVAQIFGQKIAQHASVRKAADALHTHITSAMYIGSHYFRKEWLKRLGPGPAYLLTYLRSQCYRNEETGELRDQVTFTKPQLADAIGVDKATLFRWLKKIDQKTPKYQPFFPFLKQLDTQKTAVNEVETTYRVQLNDPLTDDDLALYNKRITAYTLSINDQVKTHKESLQNETHTGIHTPRPSMQNETHAPSTNFAPMQKETHTHLTNAKRDPHPIPALQNETPSVANWDSNKHLTTLIKALEKDSNNTFAAALQKFPDLIQQWKVNQNDGKRPFSQTAVSTIDDFCQAIQIHGRRSRNILVHSGLTLAQLVAWALYAQTQPKISQEMLPGYLINRAREAESPPAEFMQLAALSWELWCCYASLLLLPHKFRDDWQNAPHFELWLQHYGQYHPNNLPFQVGQGVDKLIAFMTNDQSESITPDYSQSDNSRVMDTAVPTPPQSTKNLASSEGNSKTRMEQQQWQTALSELEMQMTKATFNTLLRNTHLLSREEETYVIGVPTLHAQAWLTNRLNNTVQRTLSAIVQEPVALRYELMS